jgi:hypothetical protein
MTLFGPGTRSRTFATLAIVASLAATFSSTTFSPVMAAGGASAGAAAGSTGASVSGTTGTLGAGVGAAGAGSAAVGGGPPAGRVGGGPPAGEVGGGVPGSTNPASNGASGTGNPSINASGTGVVSPDNPAAGLENAPTTGGVIGGNTGVPANSAATPAVTGPAMQDHPAAPVSVKGIAEQPPAATVGLARPGPDGISTEIVAPRPCSAAAHETDGTTTCVGLPASR